MATPLENIRKDRIKKLEKLKKMGVNPYPTTCERTHLTTDVIENFESLKESQDIITVAGRIISLRGHGKMAFIDIEDREGKIQVFVSKKDVGDKKYEEFKLYDVGDFVQTSGIAFLTKAGEQTIQTNSLKLLTKSIHPIPDAHFGIKDEEKRYRLRYLDLLLKPELKDIFRKKAKFWEVTRNFMKEKGFFEVETPTLEITTGGAEANPFATHHKDFDLDVYLRISVGELWQKRLMAAGYEKTFEIGRIYRNEGSSPEHLQEFTNMEFYWAYANYRDGMELTKELFQTIATEVFGTTKFTTRGHSFNLADEWQEIDYSKEIKKQTGVDISKDSDATLKAKLDELDIEYEGENRERFTDSLWKYCRKQVSGPAFLINHPKLVSPLSKSNPNDPKTTQRFQIILAGAELGNGFSELNDPLDQEERFKVQEQLIERGDNEAMMPDWEFCEMLEYGMPPTCGFGFGERLFAFLVDRPMRETTLFPLMKPTEEEMKKIRKINQTFGTCEVPTEKSENKSKKMTDIELPSRADALKILQKHVKKDFNIKHALYNEACMRAYAKKYGESEDLWGLAGLLHDINYEDKPEEHSMEPLTEPHLSELKELGIPDEVIYTIQAHGHNTKKYPRKSQMDKTLFAIDEMTGMIYAVALVRPGKFEGMKVKSVMKKFKDKAFAAKLNREEIKQGAEELGVDMNEHVQLMIEAMKEVDTNGYK